MKALFGNRGFSLTELLVVMAMFLIVLMVTASTFDTIATNASQQSKTAETQIEGILGLEILRSDLEQSGFGLPWVVSGANYTEAVVSSNNVPASGFWPGTPPSGTYWVQYFNDSPGNAPRAIQSAETLFSNYSGHGSKYIVVKSTLAGTSDTARKWTNVTFAGGVKTVRTWGSATRDFSSTERVIVVKDALNSTPPTRQLMASGGTFSRTFSTYSTVLSTPHLDGDTYQVYGVDPNTDLSMPFNRADFFVMRPAKMPQECASNTGILYKSVINQNGGGLGTPMPLLDCVADMQIAYGYNSLGTGETIDGHYPLSNDTILTNPFGTAEDIRKKLKEVRVYILAHEGKKDRLYSYPSGQIRVGEVLPGGIELGRKVDLPTVIGSGWQNYRWKVYTIVVRPKNLGQ